MNRELDDIKQCFTKIGSQMNLDIDQLNLSCITSKNNHFNLDSEGNLTVKSVAAAEGLLSYQAILDFIYPIGSIYLSVNSTNPNILFGGTWTNWANGKVLVGVDPLQEEFNTVEKAGGKKTVQLSESEMPKHTHLFSGNQLGTHGHISSGTANGGDHRHTYQNVESSKLTSSGTWAVLRPYGSSGNGLVGAGENGSGNHSHNLSITISSSSAGTPSGSNSEIGSNAPHDNLQPYITCYMWKRTA